MRASLRALFISISETCEAVVRLLIVMALARTLEPAVVGSYREVMMVIGLLQIFALIQPADSLFFFYSRVEPDRRSALLAQTLLIAVGAGILVSIPAVIGADLIGVQFQNPALAPLLRFYAVSIPAVLALSCADVTLIALDRAHFASAIRLIVASIRLVSVVGVLLLSPTLVHVLGAILATQLLGAAALGGMAFWLLGWPRRFSFDRGLLRRQFRYSVPLNLSSLLGTLTRQLDGFAVSLQFAPERYAVYSLGATEPPFIGLIPGAIASAMLPTLSNLLAAGRFDEAIAMFREASRRASLLMLPMFWLCLANADSLVVLLFGERYRESTPVFVIFLLNLPLRVAIYNSLLRALGRTDAIVRVYGVVLSVNLVLCLGAVLVGKRGPIAFYGPAVSVVLTTYLAAALLTRTIRSAVPRSAGGLLPMRELVKVFAVASVAGAAAAATRIFAPPGALLQLILSTAAFVPTFLVLGSASGAIQRRDLDEAVSILRSLSRPRL